MICKHLMNQQTYQTKCYFSLQDLHTIDMEDFKYGKTNITGFRLVDENNNGFKALVVELNTKWTGAIRKLEFPIKTIRVRSYLIFYDTLLNFINNKLHVIIL